MTKTIKYSAYLALAILTATFQGCRPDDAISGISDIKLTLSPDVFNYYYELTILDENGNPMPNAECSIARSDRELVFSQLGERTLMVDDAGKTIVVLHPYKEPTLNDPVQFTLLVSASGYDTYVKVVDVEEGMFNLEEQILMQPENAVTDYAEFETVELTLVNGELDNTSIYTKSGSNTVHIASKTANNDSLVYQGSANSAVVFVEGTKFFYWEKEFFEGQLVTEPVYSEPAVEFVKDSVFEDGAWVIRTYEKEVPARLLRMDTIIFEEPGYKMVRKEYNGKVKVNIWKMNPFLSSSNNIRTIPQWRTNGSDYLLNGLFGVMEVGRQTFNEEGVFEQFGFRISGEIDNQPVMLEAKSDSGPAVAYSAKIDPNAINSLTNAPFAEGDSLESRGYYMFPGQYKTSRYAIKRTRNGELRVEGIRSDLHWSAGKFGFHKTFKYELPVSYTINADLDGVPDKENYGAEITLQTTSSSYLFSEYLFGGGTASVTMDYFILSNDPIDPNTLRFDVHEYYWYNTATSVITGVGANYTGTYQPNDALFSGDYITYDLTLVCPDGSSIKPTYRHSFSGPGQAHFKDGQWASRYWPLGKDVKIRISQLDFDTTITLVPNNTLTRRLRNQNGQRICDAL